MSWTNRIIRSLGRSVWPLLALIGIIGIYLMARPSKGSDQEKDYADIQLSAWTNPDGMATPSEVFSLPENEFEKLETGAVPNYGFFRGAVWLRFQLEVGADNEDQLIELRNPLLNEVDLYVLDGKDLQLICATGDSRPYASRMLPHSSFVFPVEKLGQGNRQCFLRITGGGEQLLAPLHLWTPEGLANRDSADRLMRGCYFGLILFVLLLNLFLYLVIRERSSLYYVNYNCFLLLLQLSLSGYAIQYLWPSNPYLANVANPLFASLSIYWLLRFSRQFLSLHSYFPRINRVFRYTGYVVLLNAIISLIPEPNCFSASVLAINVLALCLNLAIIPVALMVLRQNFKPALFFLLAFVALVITVFGFIATNAGLIRNDFYADYGLLIGSGAEVILLSFAIVDKFKRFRDQAVTNLKRVNQMTRQQNEILEHKVALRTQKINEQKNEIEAQKEEILASIRYAQRIQKNLLPTDDQLKNLFPESFVLFQPRDIVSGDFYWTGSSVGTNADGSEYTIKLFATGDGTGHGVPGAMMSVMGINLLNTALEQLPHAQPHELISTVDRLLLQQLASENQVSGEGMDLALCAFRNDTGELTFSGANRSLHIWRNGNWIHLPGTRRAIGIRESKRHSPFIMHTQMLQPGDLVYSWTDGLTDQFGGTAGKKLMTPGLLRFLSGIAHEHMSLQKRLAEEFLHEWRRGLEQVDDICLFGLRVNRG